MMRVKFSVFIKQLKVITISKKILNSWEFYVNETLPYHSCDLFYKLLKDNKKRRMIIEKNVNVLLKVLDVLNKHNLFYPSHISLSTYKKGHTFSISASKIYFWINLEKDLNTFVNTLDLDVITVHLDGWSWITQSDRFSLFRGIINLQMDFFSETLSLNNYSDVWLPIDSEDNSLRIHEATENSKRLESCLKKIKQLGLFKRIEPDEGEDNEDLFLSKGFRIYMHENNLENKEWSEDDLDDIKPFIWKYR